jgi:hypothetical protein
MRFERPQFPHFGGGSCCGRLRVCLRRREPDERDQVKQNAYRKPCHHKAHGAPLLPKAENVANRLL